jgi:hypothetical protein
VGDAVFGLGFFTGNVDSVAIDGVVVAVADWLAVVVTTAELIGLSLAFDTGGIRKEKGKDK